VVLAWIWLDVSLGANRLMQEAASPAGNVDAMQGKLAAMRYFFAYELPKIDAWLSVVAGRVAVTREMQDAWF